MQENAPIGMFDSGVGGTSIFKEVHRLLPNEQVIYLADSKNAPYGEKSRQAIIDLSIKNTELLLEKGCKIIVVPCNTATTNAISTLRKRYEVPFIGIEPAIKPAALGSKSKAVGVLATKGTLTSALFQETSSTYTKDINVVEVVGTGLVQLIEAGKKDSEEVHDLLLALLQPMLRAKIDYLVLGCSHYPYLIPQLVKILPPSVKIIDSGAAVANQTKAVLTQRNLLTNRLQGGCSFYSNVNPYVLCDLVEADKYGFVCEKLSF